MKKTISIVMISLWAMVASAQPRPYEVDQSFIPSLEYLQKSWSGEYDGYEPNSRMILSIKRSLVLNPDLSYTNLVTGQIKNESEEVILKLETGTYQYDSGTQFVSYSIETDSILDINIFLQGNDSSYLVNHYKQDGKEKLVKEKAQFTAAANDADRQWVLFDQQLMSPIDMRQKAVYVMTGKENEPSSIVSIYKKYNNNIYYDLKGHRIERPTRGVFIFNGKKYYTGNNLLPLSRF